MAKKLIKPEILWEKHKRLLDDKRRGFWDYWSAMQLVLDSQSYLVKYKTADDFIKSETELGRSTVYQLCKDSQTRVRLSDYSDSPPDQPAQLREIAKVPVNKQKEVFAEVSAKCEQEKREPTAKDYRAAAKPFVKETNDQPAKVDTPLAKAVKTDQDWKLVRKMAVHRANQCMRDIDDLWNVRASGNPSRHDEAIKCIQRVVVLLGEWA